MEMHLLARHGAAGPVRCGLVAGVDVVWRCGLLPIECLLCRLPLHAMSQSVSRFNPALSLTWHMHIWKLMPSPRQGDQVSKLK